MGQLRWKWKQVGHQGDFYGFGLVGGYRMPLNEMFDLDFNLGFGYTSYTYDKYHDIDGYLIPIEKGLTKNYWGIGSAGVTLVYKW